MGFRDDDRAVSSLIAAVFVFGFLVIALSLYQGFVVPDHNEEVEFKHSQTVQNDMVAVRNAILRTKVTGEESYVSVTLGTQYPSRIVAVNPPPASGTLRTTPLQSFTVQNETGTDISTTACPGQPETRFLEYAPSYSVYQNAPTLVYEHSVLYKQFSSGNVTMTGQTLVEGNTINLVPVKSAYSENGVGSVTFDPKAGRLKSTNVKEPTVTLPTRLSESGWERLLAGQVDPGNVTVSGGTLTLDPAGEYTVRCGPVAVGEVPESGARGTGGTGINPAGPDDVELRDARLVGGGTKSKTVEVDLNNTASNDTTIQEARISFFFNGPNGNEDPTEADLIDPDSGQVSATLVVKEEATVLDPKIELAGNFTETTVTLEWNDHVRPDDFFVLQVTFETGETGTYFVAPE
jgi:hypothetical protein